MGQPLHADQQTTAMTVSTIPFFDVFVNGSPAAQVEVAHTKVCSVGNCHGFRQGWTERLFNVIENSRHGTRSQRSVSVGYQGGGALSTAKSISRSSGLRRERRVLRNPHHESICNSVWREIALKSESL